jgi:hypothetical protein
LKKVAEEHQKSPWGIIRMTPGQDASAAVTLSPILDIPKRSEADVRARERP